MIDTAPPAGPSMRPVVVGLSLALIVALSGCSGTLVEYTASPAEIPDAALESQGYVHGNTTMVPLSYRLGAAGVSRDITAQTWVAGYSKTTPDNDTAAVVLYSSPNVELADRSVNPLSQLSNRELIQFGIDRMTDLRGIGGIENVSDLSETGTRNVTMLGTQTQLVTYTGTAEIDGRRVAIIANVAMVEHGDDIVVAMGIHESVLDETPAHSALVEAVVHED